MKNHQPWIRGILYVFRKREHKKRNQIIQANFKIRTYTKMTNNEFEN